jgi:hypothetical protein
MTVESDLFDSVKGLVGNRAYPDEAPADTALPYIVYQQVGGTAPTFLENALPSKENGRFQFTVWALTRAQAKSISKQIEAALVVDTDFQARPLGAPIAVIDDDTKYRGSRQDYTVWSTR